ncbi:hypothetical protein C1646_777455 [Rhizophagus diaphanus]|nr:hypothetical protein C1646_777455 [Rhizophagus diaphanus] [Rhizophagus sp. MUCL 43196]
MIQNIQDLYNFCQNNNHILYVKIFIYFIIYNCNQLINNLKFFKVRNKAIVPFVYSQIINLQAFLSSGKRNSLISNKIIQILSEVNNNVNFYMPLFAKAFILVYEKCEKYISQHLALPLFKAIQCFDPKFIQSNTANHNMEDYRVIKEFHFPTDALIQEWAIYCELRLLV